MKEESPYCSKCEACGEELCCSFINCFSELIKRSDCEYGESYLKDARFARLLAELGENVINQLENGLYNKELAIEEYHKKWNEIYDKIYGV